MAVTMRDVAQKAGVSIKTVSRVVNNQGEITDETRRRVQTVIDELGYRPNTLARGLVSGKTLSVGMVISQITDPFFPEIVLGVESVARQHGYTVFLCNASGDTEQELKYIDILEGKQADGVILCGSGLDKEQLTRVGARRCIAVLTTHAPQGTAIVTIAEETAYQEIVSLLIRAGHRAIGHIPVSTKSSEHWRMRGYRQALDAHAIPLDERWICASGSIAVEAGRQAARQLLKQASEITAIACFNDLIAVGALQACAELGRRVPQDIAVTGFDDIELASLVTPKLTTVHVPRYRLGKELMQGLLRLIETDRADVRHTMIDLDLVVRESCGTAA